ncbi:MAG: RidA family protein [Gammaproteobacteria bacterium]
MANNEDKKGLEVLQPPGWPRPKGYANGIAATGRQVYVGGMIGWNEKEQFPSDDFIEQAEQALKNTVAVLAEAGAKPEHVVRMTWYVTDKNDYMSRLPEVGKIYRGVMGYHFPAMALLQIVALVEDRAKVEIETTAVIPD